jgi:voltage-gated potassium channel
MAASSVDPEGPVRTGSAADTAKVQRFDAFMRIPLVVSAVLPLIIVPSEGSWVAIVVGILTWLVFLVDYVFHLRYDEGYMRTWFGRFDLVVVIVTAPWYLIPGAQGGGWVVLFRLARVVRILMVSRGARRLFQRLGRVAGVALGVVFVASLVAYFAEHPTNPEFGNVGDAFWWGIVTLTTVGYGDIVPKTSTGRWAGVVIMFTGIGVLGVLAGSLASFFRLEPDDKTGGTDAPEGEPARAAADGNARDATLSTLVTEVAAMRAQLTLLADRVTELGGGRPAAGPPEAGPS